MNVNLQLERSKFIKKYAAKLAQLPPEHQAALLWDEVKKSWSDGFATARLTEWDTATGLAKTFTEHLTKERS